MADNQEKETLADSWLRSLKNYRAIAAAMLLATIIGLLGSFTTGIAAITDTVYKTFTLFVRDPDNPGDQDKRLERAIMKGRWHYSIKLPYSNEVISIEYRSTFLPDGTVIQSGFFISHDQSYSIAVSGTWSIRDGRLYYKVVSTNVPWAVPEGLSTVARISITKDVLTSINEKDGTVQVYSRVK